MAYASPMKIANGLVLDFTVDNAVTATDAFLGLNALGEVTQFASVPRSRVSGGGNITESTSAVLTISGGTGAALTSALTIQVLQAGAAQSGYLSTTDWNTFNNKLSSSLTSAFFYVGNGSGVATGVAMSGDISITNAGVAAIAAGVIVDADVNSGAAIAFSKMAALTANRIVASNGSGVVSILDTATYPSITELSYVKGVTSSLQTQIDSKLSVTLAGVTSGDVISYNGAAWVNTPSSGTGIPTAGTTNQILRKIDNTNYNAEWHTLVAADLTDVSSSAAELNKLTGVTTTPTQFNFLNTLVGDVQSQIAAKLTSSLTLNNIWVGDASNIPTPLAAGTNGYVLTSVSGTPTWVSPGSGGTVTSVAGSGGTTGMSFTGSPVTVSGTLTLTGTLIAANGGTGFASYAVGDILYANTTTTLAKLADVAAGSYLRSGGVSTAPVWSTTTLPNSATIGDILYASASNVYSNLGAGTATHVLTSNGAGVAPSWQAAGAVGAWLLASGGTATGTNTFAMGSNPFIMTTGVTTGTGATAGHQLVGNSLTTGNLFDASSSSVSTGSLGVFTSTSTVINHTAGTNGLVEVSMSGANSTASKTAIGLYSKVTNTGTTNTNIAGYFEASGGTTNNAVVIGAGNMILSSGAQQNIFKSGGALFLGTNDFNSLQFGTNSTVRLSINGSSSAHIYSTGGVMSSGSIQHFTWNPANATTQTASAEAVGYTFNGPNIQFSNGAITTLRGTVFGAPNYSHVSGSNTITTSATLAITGAPTTSGGFTTITNPLAFWTQSGAVRFDAPSSVFIANASGDTPTASTRLDVRGVSGGTILRLANHNNSTLYTTVANDSGLLTHAASIAMTGSATTFTLGGGATASELRFLEPSGGGSSYVGFKAPALAGNITFTLPPAFVAGGVLTDVVGDGVLTMVAGSVIGPAFATDNALVRFDGTTGKLVQNSGVIIDDSDNITASSFAMGAYTASSSALQNSLIQNIAIAASSTGFQGMAIPAYGNNTVVYAQFIAIAVKSDGSTGATAIVNSTFRKNGSGTWSVDVAGTSTTSDATVIATIAGAINGGVPGLDWNTGAYSGTYTLGYSVRLTAHRY